MLATSVARGLGYLFFGLNVKARPLLHHLKKVGLGPSLNTCP